MIVCLCKAVSDGAIERAVAEGDHSVEALARRCGVGTECGMCLPTLEDMLARIPCDKGCADCPRRDPRPAH